MPVSVREFKAHLSRYLAEVQAGKTLEISRHRKVVARLTGVPETSDKGISRLLQTGTASWQGGKPRGGRVEVSAAGTPVSQVILEDRDS